VKDSDAGEPVTPEGRVIGTVTGEVGEALHPLTSPLGELLATSLYVIVVESPAVMVVTPAVVPASLWRLSANAPPRLRKPHQWPLQPPQPWRGSLSFLFVLNPYRSSVLLVSAPQRRNCFFVGHSESAGDVPRGSHRLPLPSPA